MPADDRVWRERHLRAAVLAGDEAAWRVWYDECFADLLAYLRWRCGGQRDLVEEAAQETWLIAVRRIRDFEAAQGPFAAWLRGIAANVVRNLVRRAVHRPPAHALNGQAKAPSSSQEQETAARIARALAELPDHYEAVLRGKYLDGQSVAELAAARGETPKAVESLLTRARQAFREAYQRME